MIQCFVGQTAESDDGAGGPPDGGGPPEGAGPPVGADPPGGADDVAQVAPPTTHHPDTREERP